MPATNTIEIVIEAKDKASRTLGAVGDNLKTIGKIALGGFATLGTAAAGAAAGIAKLALDAAPLEAVRSAFDGLAESADIGGREMLRALEEGSDGMIAQRDLMVSFNKAAQLVSTDFARRLPDAMGMLGKVAAATGQDLDFLLDSLVTGVGRLSPMILDNLGIQIDLTAAQEAYADEIGKTTEELTKQEQQTALMNQVMELLTRNTAAMPDIAGKAASGMAQLRSTFQNLKDQMGMAFVPTLNTVLSTLAELGQIVLPIIADFMTTVVAPAVQFVVSALRDFISQILQGTAPVKALTELLGQFLPPEAVQNVLSFVASIQQFIAVISPIGQQIAEWIAQSVGLQDVLIALGVAIAAVVIPSIVSMVTAAAPIVATFLAVLAIVAALRAAWENDFLGMRTAITQFWQESLQPAFEQIAQWMQVNIPAAIQALQNFWSNVLLPALQTVWEFIQGTLMPLLSAWGELISVTLTLAVTALAGVWKNVLEPALRPIITIVQDLATRIGNNLLPVLRILAEFIGGALRRAFDGIGEAIGKVTEFIGRLAEKIANIKLPDWMTPGSPTPLEMGLLGIGDALRQLSTVDLPAFQMSVNGNQQMLPGTQYNNSISETVNIYGAHGGAAYEERRRRERARILGRTM